MYARISISMLEFKGFNSRAHLSLQLRPTTYPHHGKAADDKEFRKGEGLSLFDTILEEELNEENVVRWRARLSRSNKIRLHDLAPAPKTHLRSGSVRKERKSNGTAHY